MTDLATIGKDSNQWRSSVSAVTSGLRKMGVDTEPMQVIMSTLSLFSGIAGGASAVASLIGAYQSMATAEAVAETAVRTAEGPPGWALIALAAGTATASGAVFYNVARTHNIRGNFDNPSEAKLAAITAGALQ